MKEKKTFSESLSRQHHRKETAELHNFFAHQS